GFGVPLVESMIFDLPVIGYKAGSVPETMGGAGLLVSEKRFTEIAALIKVLAEDRPLHRAIREGQRRRVAEFHPSKLKVQLAAKLAQIGIEVPRPAVESQPEAQARDRFQVEGPIETS